VQVQARPKTVDRFKAFAAYFRRNRSFLGRVFKQYARNTVNVRILKRKYPDILSQEVSTEKTIELLRILRPQLGSLYITGGEPLVRADLEEVMRAAADLRYSTILHTNGALLDRREKLLDYIQSLVISLDSMNEGRFDSITQSAPGTTQRIISNLVRYGRQMRETHRPMTINCVIDRRTVDDVYDVMEFCREHDFIFSCCSALKSDLTNYELLKDDRYVKLVEHILESKRRKRQRINGSVEELEHILRRKDFNCYPTLFARIYPNGDVYYPCVPLKTVGGNLFETSSLKEIYRRAREKLGDIPHCRGRCHLYSNITSHFYVHNFWNLAREYK
jgi:MoaA/NifB/PqqE/SkfB family radical SAM enzyme